MCSIFLWFSFLFLAKKPQVEEATEAVEEKEKPAQEETPKTEAPAVKVEETKVIK